MARKSTSSVHQAAKTLGSRGGKKGGPARARALTAEERRNIAAKGARAANRKK